jgi:RimJ/RimL family protein N-acetyltransferase
MDSASWPLPRLRLRTPDLLLRPTTEADLPGVAGTLSGEVSGDPNLPRFESLDQPTRAEVAARQSYWQSVGNWSVDNWRLDFVVVSGERIVGVQSLEGEDFPVLRTVDSASHLAPDARGHGWGKQARRAVLAFAFGSLGAEYAITSAWHHNGPSLGVSRSLGYRPNGVSRHRSDTGPGADTLVHLRLSREDWEASGQASTVEVSGFEGCAPFFGL